MCSLRVISGIMKITVRYHINSFCKLTLLLENYYYERQAIIDIVDRSESNNLSKSILKYNPLTKNTQRHVKIKYILELHSTI